MTSPTPTRTSWIDESSQAPAIDGLARQLDTFAATFADGRVDDDELRAQERRLTALMREIEPRLDDDLHAKVTQLLCELTAYDIMQFASSLRQARPETRFRG